MVDVEGIRSNLIVPLSLRGTGIGCISLSRREVAPFSDDEIALVEMPDEAVLLRFRSIFLKFAVKVDRVTEQLAFR